MTYYKEGEISSLLESIFEEYHKPEYIHPDPLEFLLKYPDPAEREIAGIIASSFALGRVEAILKVVDYILSKLPSPLTELSAMDLNHLEAIFQGFRYRFYDERALTDFLSGIGRILREYGSLNECFKAGLKAGTLNAALKFFTGELRFKNRKGRSVLPDPSLGSACKRLNLYLRWMVRKDSIDPGGWTGISASDLIVPLDTHMLKIGRILGFTFRKSGDLISALEITDSLRRFDPQDPVRFDFSLTRLGIHPGLDYSRLDS